MAADRLLNALYAKFDKLADNPYLGSECEHFGQGLRSFVVKNYVIYYRPLVNHVEISRVLHSAQDHYAAFSVGSSDS